MTKSNTAIAIVLLLALGIGLFLILRNDDEPTEPTTALTQAEIASDEEVPENEPSEPILTTEPAKIPVLSGNVTEKPIVSNSFGLTEESPVPDGQLVSTTCATAPGVECILIATNIEDGTIVSFDVMNTDASGGASWEWTAGNEISAGTWDMTVQAGDKTSNSEVIYVL